MVNEVNIRICVLLLAIVLQAIAGFVMADEVKFYDQVPSVDELQRELLGFDAGTTAPQKKGRRTRSFQVDDDAQQASDMSPDGHPNIGSVRIEIKDKNEIQQPLAAPAVVKSANSVLAFPINFDIGSTQLRPESLKYLDAIAQVMKKGNVAILVEGHTDISGNPLGNYKLSRDRAYSVLNYLVDQHGIHPSRLSAMGVGSKEPLNGEDPTSSKNRRVQIRVRPS